MRASLKALLATLPPVDSVQEADDGEQALRFVSEWKPDVVLLDARMRALDGVQTTRAIKALAPGVRVIVLSLYPEYREQAMEAGASDFVIKGADSQDLLNAILGG